jgi:hypothetical protein
MPLRILTAVLAMLFATLPAFADDKPKDPPKPEPSYDIPYKLTDSKHVMVRVKLNGKGPFNFILDTGAPALIMTEAVAKKTGVELDKGWGKFKLDVEGGLTIPEAKGLAMDMFQLKGMNAMGIAGVELHGVIGYNTLAKFRIQYDFTEDKLIWTPLKYDPPPLKRLKDEDKGDQGGLEMIGGMMKILAPLMGLRPNFEIKPRGFLGLELELKKDEVFVKSVVKSGPADRAGIAPGDQIEFAAAGVKKGEKIDFARGTDVDSIDDVLKTAGKLGEGDKLKIRIKRGGDTKELTIELGKGL